MRLVTVRESRSESVSLSDEDAIELNRVGRDLAVKVQRGGSELKDGATSVLRCSPLSPGLWNVFADNVVGVVAIDGLQLVIRPKVPLSHLMYLFSRAKILPRFIADEVQVSEDETLFDLIAEWYFSAIDRLLHSDLLHDYRDVLGETDSMRGSIDAVSMAQAYYSGSIKFTARYDEFDADTPLNRVLKAGAQAILRNGNFQLGLRRRSRRVLSRFDQVGSLRDQDLRVSTDRLTASYADALMLSKVLISGEGRSISPGARRGWSFLIPTPHSVEQAIRNILSDALGLSCPVLKISRGIGNGLTVNPDLWFQSYDRVGDVKYKRFDQWYRGDLYQSVAFAAAFESDDAVVISFADAAEENPLPVQFGRIKVTPINWNASPNIRASLAAEDLVKRVTEWLGLRDSEARSREPSTVPI